MTQDLKAAIEQAEEIIKHITIGIEGEQNSIAGMLQTLIDHASRSPAEVTVQEFIGGCVHILSQQSAELMQKYIRHYYPNGIRIVK